MSIVYLTQTPNPVRVVRKSLQKTLEKFAHDCGVHPQALFLTEQGCYPRILPEIRRYMGTLRDPNRNWESAPALYAVYQRQKREFFGSLYALQDLDLDQLGPPGSMAPVVAFRGQIGLEMGHPKGLSRMGFAKSFCIHPAELYSLENGLKHILSEQFRLAMTQAGLDATVLVEIEYRCGEYADGEWVS